MFEISQMSNVGILNKCEIPLRPPGKDVALPGTEKKMGVIQGGAAQIKITEVRQAIRTSKTQKSLHPLQVCRHIPSRYGVSQLQSMLMQLECPDPHFKLLLKHLLCIYLHGGAGLIQRRCPFSVFLQL